MSKQPKTININELISTARLNANCGEYAPRSMVIELCDAIESLLAIPLENSRLEAEVQLLKKDHDHAMEVLSEANDKILAAHKAIPKASTQEIMTKVDEYAGVWALVDTGFDLGSCRQKAMEIKADIKIMIGGAE